MSIYSKNISNPLNRNMESANHPRNSIWTKNSNGDLSYLERTQIPSPKFLIESKTIYKI